jgi:hypothetical protein
MQTLYRYIEFVEDKPKPKTKVWKCLNRSQRSQLGIVEWYGPWRRYVYVPSICAVYSGECLKDIDHFLAQADRQQKQRKAASQSLTANK